MPLNISLSVGSDNVFRPVGESLGHLLPWRRQERHRETDSILLCGFANGPGSSFNSRAAKKHSDAWDPRCLGRGEKGSGVNSTEKSSAKKIDKDGAGSKPRYSWSTWRWEGGRRIKAFSSGVVLINTNQTSLVPAQSILMFRLWHAFKY